jgi:hypothetical protein
VPLSDSLSIEFGQVTLQGLTTFTRDTAGPPPPDGFDLAPVSPAQYFDIQTTSTVTPPITVCFTYDESWLSGLETDLRLMHYEGGMWIDVTASQDLTNNAICGLVNSLSPFVLAQPALCACDCHRDPGGNCDGVQTILDVVEAVNVAFRNAPSIPDPNVACPFETTDVNCDNVTTVLDVVRMVNVAFRNANVATEFCIPCP